MAKLMINYVGWCCCAGESANCLFARILAKEISYSLLIVALCLPVFQFSREPSLEVRSPDPKRIVMEPTPTPNML